MLYDTSLLTSGFPVVEYCVQQLKDFVGKKFKSTTKEGLDIEGDDKQKVDGAEGEAQAIHHCLAHEAGLRGQVRQVGEMHVHDVGIRLVCEHGAYHAYHICIQQRIVGTSAALARTIVQSAGSNNTNKQKRKNKKKKQQKT